KLMDKAILALDYLPSSQQLALCTVRSIALWDLQSDEPIFESKVPRSSMDVYNDIVTIACSPRGQFLASSSADYIVHLWRRRPVEGDIETWSCEFALCVFHDFIASISWNPVVPTEFVTSSMDGSVRLWRMSSEDGTMAVKMLWGTNLRRLCSACAVLEGATGLSPIHQTLLAQRSNFDGGLSLDNDGSDDESEDDD
ncbi:hypothetical protein BGZ91_004307, partial [Linnemannia elongata]